GTHPHAIPRNTARIAPRGTTSAAPGTPRTAIRRRGPGTRRSRRSPRAQATPRRGGAKAPPTPRGGHFRDHFRRVTRDGVPAARRRGGGEAGRAPGGEAAWVVTRFRVDDRADGLRVHSRLVPGSSVIDPQAPAIVVPRLHAERITPVVRGDVAARVRRAERVTRITGALVAGACPGASRRAVPAAPPGAAARPALGVGDPGGAQGVAAAPGRAAGGRGPVAGPCRTARGTPRPRAAAPGLAAAPGVPARGTVSPA